MSLWSKIKKAAKSVVKTVSKVVSKVAKGVETAVTTAIKNPLPIIETVALTAVIGPGGLALASEAGAAAISSAAVKAANGGSIKDIATAAATSYVGGKVGEQAGYATAQTGTTSDTLVKVASSAAGASTQSVLTGLAQGKNLTDALASGAQSGITAGLTTGAMEGIKSVANPQLSTAGTAPIVERSTSETGEPVQQVYGGQEFPISETASTGKATSDPLISGTSSQLLSSALGQGIYSGLFGSSSQAPISGGTTTPKPPVQPVSPTQTASSVGSQALGQALRIGDAGAPVFGGDKEGGKKSGWNVESLRYMSNSEA